MFFRICALLLRPHDDFLLLQQIQSAVPGIPLTINTVMAPEAQRSESAGQGSDPPPFDCSSRSKGHTRIRRTY